MPSGRSLPKPQTWRIENASAAAFMARSAWLTPSILAHGDDGARAGAVERDRQFRLPPELRQQRDHKAGAMRGQHRQHEFDGVRQLHRDHRIGRQARLDEMRRQRGDRAVGLARRSAAAAAGR